MSNLVVSQSLWKQILWNNACVHSSCVQSVKLIQQKHMQINSIWKALAIKERFNLSHALPDR